MKFLLFLLKTTKSLLTFFLSDLLWKYCCVRWSRSSETPSSDYWRTSQKSIFLMLVVVSHTFIFIFSCFLELLDCEGTEEIQEINQKLRSVLWWRFVLKPFWQKFHKKHMYIDIFTLNVLDHWNICLHGLIINISGKYLNNFLGLLKFQHLNWNLFSLVLEFLKKKKKN